MDSPSANVTPELLRAVHRGDQRAARQLGALAELTPPTALITRLRNWSLATAGAATLTLAIMLVLQETKTQFIPIPKFDLPSPSKP
jgi:hypothetical protein